MRTFDCEICRTDGNTRNLCNASISGYTMIPQSYGVTWCCNCGTVITTYNSSIETCFLIGGQSDTNVETARKKYLNRKDIINKGK
jgi:hypothetical protein